jgi:penicillin amidase
MGKRASSSAIRGSALVVLLAIGACGDDRKAPPNFDTEGDDEGDSGTAGSSGGSDDGFAGLSAPVDIFVDARGIPHIYAQTDQDAMFAAGYQQATDRLFQMDLMRRRALGRQAEVLGPDKVAQDEISRLFDFRRWGAANVERMRDEAPEVHALIEAWLAGVNRRIEEVVAGEVPLPYGFGPDEASYMPEPWTLEEHSAIAKLLFFGNSNSLERELLTTIVMRNFPDAFEKIELARPMFPVATMPEDELPEPLGAPLPPPLAAGPIRPPIEATGGELVAAMARLRGALGHVPRVGSNNWAIDGRHTETGTPFVANDPHQPLQSPSLMYAQHLNSVDAGGTLDIAGWAFAGAAGVHLGHNRDVQWAATTNFADVMDIWEVQVDGDEVVLGGQRVAITEREETIEVAGADAQTFVVRDVPGYGVLLPDDIVPIPIAGPDHALLLGWTGFTATNEERCFMQMAVARDLDEYEAAVDLMEVGGFNFVSATSEGISYRVNILVPDRGDPSARPMPFAVVSGDDPGAFWSGFLPPERLPRSRAEGTGWIATANNDPWGFTFDGDVSNDPWYYGYFFAAGHRAHRLAQEIDRLTSEGGITLEAMQALQTDVTSPMAQTLLPHLADAAAAIGTDPALDEFADDPDLERLVTLLTEEWDMRMARDSAGALAFHCWLIFLTEEAVGDELSILFNTVLEEETPFAIKLPGLAVTGQYPRSDEILQEGRDLILLEALRRTAQLLNARFGGVDPAGYTWGDMHGTRFDNPFGGRLDGGFVPTDGGEDTVNVSSSKFYGESDVAERFDSTSGAIFRVVTTFGADGLPEAWANFPRGNSGDPDSPHWDDTLDAWIAGDYEPLPFRRAEVDAATVTTLRLEP